MVIEKAALKEALKELIVEEPSFVEDLLEELATDLKKRRLEEIINEDFREYDDVFKKLA